MSFALTLDTIGPTVPCPRIQMNNLCSNHGCRRTNSTLTLDTRELTHPLTLDTWGSMICLSQDTGEPTLSWPCLQGGQVFFDHLYRRTSCSLAMDTEGPNLHLSPDKGRLTFPEPEYRRTTFSLILVAGGPTAPWYMRTNSSQPWTQESQLCAYPWIQAN